MTQYWSIMGDPLGGDHFIPCYGGSMNDLSADGNHVILNKHSPTCLPDRKKLGVMNLAKLSLHEKPCFNQYQDGREEKEINLPRIELPRSPLPVAAVMCADEAHLNISPSLLNKTEAKYTGESYPVLAYQKKEVCLLRQDNSRLREEIEESKIHSQSLESEISTLKNLLKKNEEANTLQKRRLEGLERQICALGLTTSRYFKFPDPGSARQTEPSTSEFKHCSAPPSATPSGSSSGYGSSGGAGDTSPYLSVADVPLQMPPRFNSEPAPLSAPVYTRPRFWSESQVERIPSSPDDRKKRSSSYAPQRYDTRYKPRRYCSRDVSITFTEAPQFGPHKVILVGDSGVGKSSFMLRLCDDAFNEKMNPSFGLDFKTKVIPVNGTEESIQIWDTAGQERFRSITQSYFRKVDGIILVYDITHEESFLNLQSWVSCIQESGQLTAPITIVGNKLDLEHLRCVTREMATELADFYEAEFVEVSAKNGKNINEVGYELVRKLVEQRTLNSKQAAELPFPVSRPSASDCTETTCSCVIL